MTVEKQDGSVLITRYKETGDKKLRNDIVLFYGNLINYTVISMRNMYQKYADSEDIANEAAIALMSAIETFDLSRNVKFETYASIKMRGAVIDYIRKQDIVPRSLRHFSREMDKAFAELYSELGREPSSEELAEKMGLPHEKLLKLMADASAAVTLSFEELLYESDFDIGDQSSGDVWEAEKRICKNEKKEQLAKAVDSLKEQERNVISLYYYERLKFSDIAKVLDVSESRVCQIHSKAIMRLKMALESYIKQ